MGLKQLLVGGRAPMRRWLMRQPIDRKTIPTMPIAASLLSTRGEGHPLAHGRCSCCCC
jgi:hypothetical protein